jgi:hypothetical protein
MSNELGYLDELAKAGFFMTCASGVVVPSAWAAAGEMFVMIGDPGALLDAGLAWFDAASEMQTAIEANIEVTNGLALSWEGTDHDAFVAQAADYTRQLMTTQVMAYTIGTVMVAAALMVTLAAIVIFAMGIGFALWATAIFISMASVAGNLGVTQTLIFDAGIYAFNCEAGLRTLDSTLLTAYNVMGGVIGVALAADVAAQMALGNEEALGDLGEATVLGIPTIAAGLVSAFFTKSVGMGMKPPFGDPVLRILGIGTQATGVDPVGEVTQGVDPSRWGE